MKNFLTVLLLLVPFSLVKAQGSHFIKFNDSRIAYEGRVSRPDTAACELYWPGTSVTVNFQGTGISALLQDEKGLNYYNVIIDNRQISKIQLTQGKQRYVLAQNLQSGRHTLQLFKRTEWEEGTTRFYGFELAGNTSLLKAPAPKKRKIEFYGNSITSGYAIEDSVESDGDSPEGKYKNNYLSYAAVTARHFNAQYHCTSKSGIGVMVSWFPMIMPEMYDRLNPNNEQSKWDFSSYQPDVVVINLGENDASLTAHPESGHFKFRFGDKKPDAGFIIKSYQNFYSTIRSKYPKATIICALGDMSATRPGSPWAGYITQAVANLHDAKMLTCFFSPRAAYGHPRVKDDQQMADYLIQFIDAHVKW